MHHGLHEVLTPVRSEAQPEVPLDEVPNPGRARSFHQCLLWISFDWLLSPLGPLSLELLKGPLTNELLSLRPSFHGFELCQLCCHLVFQDNTRFCAVTNFLGVPAHPDPTNFSLMNRLELAKVSPTTCPLLTQDCPIPSGPPGSHC